MLTSKQTKELSQIASVSLDAAESIWNQVGDELAMAANSRAFTMKLAESIDTQIPGHPTVEPGKPKVDHFIAIVADMRDSTKHLLCSISQKTARVSQLQRVFYETAALLPSLAKAIAYEEGHVTEYLGDGILGLFCVDKDDKNKTIYASKRAANKCMDAVRDVVNPQLFSRYNLPPLRIGIGLAYSKAVVTLVGLPDFMQPKVFGECVFRATKLSEGTDAVMIDEALKCIWPKTENGTLCFVPCKVGNLDGYLVQKKNN
ncbi:MAG: adenylate/guanylate cyclase [Kiritimatiellae bacterium]|jgi:hypothetical protein|nr:adenylate/guanylate cyclase [Kiritimatiellia bacterium]